MQVHQTSNFLLIHVHVHMQFDALKSTLDNYLCNQHPFLHVFWFSFRKRERERERDLLPIRLLNVLNFLLQRQLFYSYIVLVANRVRIYSIIVVTFPITERSVAPAPLINITIYKIFIDDRFLKEMRI